MRLNDIEVFGNVQVDYRPWTSRI